MCGNSLADKLFSWIKLLEQGRQEGRQESQAELDRLRNLIHQLQTDGKTSNSDQYDSRALNPAHQVDANDTHPEENDRNPTGL
jgi:hypothetical protein